MIGYLLELVSSSSHDPHKTVARNVCVSMNRLSTRSGWRYMCVAVHVMGGGTDMDCRIFRMPPPGVEVEFANGSVHMTESVP